MLDKVPITQEDLANKENIFNQVDNVIALSISTGDPLLACEFGAKLEKVARIAGVALAKLFFKLKDSWDVISSGGVEEDFYSFVEAHMGYRPRTIRKYIDMWESIFEYSDLPDDIKEGLSGKNMRELLNLSSAVRDGSLTEEDLQAAIITDEQGIREIVRRARGLEPPTDTAIHIMLEVRGNEYVPEGALEAVQNGEREVIGKLNLRAKTDFGRKAVERIINSSARILEK